MSAREQLAVVVILGRIPIKEKANAPFKAETSKLARVQFEHLMKAAGKKIGPATKYRTPNRTRLFWHRQAVGHASARRTVACFTRQDCLSLASSEIAFAAAR
jgi:hypothetical protein